MHTWLNRSQVLRSMRRRVFALWNNCPLGTYRLFLQSGNHGHVPGSSTSHIQSLTLQSIWTRAQKPPTHSLGRNSHVGWKDVLWSCLAEPGLASLCMEEAPASTAMHAETLKSAISLFHGKDMLTRVSCIRKFEACELLAFLSCVINFQYIVSLSKKCFRL